MTPPSLASCVVFPVMYGESDDQIPAPRSSRAWRGFQSSQPDAAARRPADGRCGARPHTRRRSGGAAFRDDRQMPLATSCCSFAYVEKP